MFTSSVAITGRQQLPDVNNDRNYVNQATASFNQTGHLQLVVGVLLPCEISGKYCILLKGSNWRPRVFPKWRYLSRMLARQAGEYDSGSVTTDHNACLRVTYSGVESVELHFFSQWNNDRTPVRHAFVGVSFTALEASTTPHSSAGI